MVLSGVNNSVQAIGINDTMPGGSGDRPAAGYITNTSSGPTQMPGPVIHLPGHVPKSGGFSALLRQGQQPAGYTAEHAIYPIVRHERIREAYAIHNAELIIVEARLVVKLPGKVRADLVHVRE